MSVSAILGGWASFSKLTSSSDDDWVDRLNHIFTVILLAIFALFISGGQYVGNPIKCWPTDQIDGARLAYAESYCWVKNTYYIPIEDDIPSEPYRRDSELTYYQWVPIMLLFMAFLFKFPCLIWRMFNGGSAIDLDKIVNMTMSTQFGDPAKRQETIKHISLYLDRWLEAHRQYTFNALVRMRQRVSKVFCFLCAKRDGTYLTGLYIFVKLLYVSNVICQFFILNSFMGGWYSVYGFTVLNGLATDHSWRESPHFPKVTLCDFQIRQLTNVQPYTVQCVLPINLFNEKVFIFLWFWFCFVAVLTAGNFIFWLWRALIRFNRVAYIKKYLRILDELRGEADKKLARQFADQYLRDDGIFVLRLIAKNSNDILVSDLVLEMWKTYKNKPMIRKTSVGDDDYTKELPV